MRLLDDDEIRKLGGNPDEYSETVAVWTAEDVEQYLEDNEVECTDKKKKEFIAFAIEKIFIGSMNEDWGYAMDTLVGMFDFREDLVKDALKGSLEKEETEDV